MASLDKLMAFRARESVSLAVLISVFFVRNEIFNIIASVRATVSHFTADSNDGINRIVFAPV